MTEQPPERHSPYTVSRERLAEMLEEDVELDRRYSIQREMARTPLKYACADPAITISQQLIECRRRPGHPDQHAHGYGITYKEWD